MCNGKVNDDPLVKAIDTEVAMVNKDDVWLDNIWSVSTLQNEHKMELTIGSELLTRQNSRA